MSDYIVFPGKQMSELDPPQSQALLSLVFDVSPVGMCVLKTIRDPQYGVIDFECTLANAAIEEHTGFLPLAGHRMSVLQPLISPTISIAHLIGVIDENGTIEREAAFSGHNGFRWLRITLHKFEDGILMITEDRTNSARIEEEIRHQAELFTKVVEASPDIIQIVSLASEKSTYINKILLEELKYPFEEIRKIESGNGLRALIHPDDINAYDTFLADLRNSPNDATVEIEVRIRAYNKSWMWYRTRAKVFERDPFGVPRTLLAFSQDVTPQKLSEEDKRKHQLLREVEKARTTFFNNISHEFRTPLTLLLAPLEEIIEKQNVFKSDIEKIRMAYRNALRLQRLVNTLLEFSRMESGQRDTIFLPTDLSRLTADLAANFRSIIEHARLRFKVSCAAIGEPIYVNRDMYEKIMFNLLSNAFKYTFSGKIEVVLKDNKNHIKLIIRDTGIGIEQKHLDTIFDRFTRIDEKRGRTYEGSGIGLSFVRELVSCHGGNIKVTSEPGKGSAFTVTLLKGKAHLPRKNIHESRGYEFDTHRAEMYVEELKSWTAGPQAGERRKKRAVRKEAAPADSRPSILIADDNADMRAYLRRLLSDNYDISVVSNGKQAVEFLQHNKLPDLVLADVMMPEMNGYQLLQAIKGHERTKHIPVVLVTARISEDSVLEGIRTGADDYIVKPFSAKELLARVEARMQQRLR